MQADLQPLLRKLVDEQFREWGGPPPADSEERLRRVLAWLSTQTALHRHAATALIARLQPVLQRLGERVLPSGRERFFFRLDASHIEKSPESILEKMARAWRDQRTDAPPFNFHNLAELKDLGRFRIVANFLSDAFAIQKALERPFQTDERTLEDSELELRREFQLHGNHFQDLIGLLPGTRKTGERCLKGSFYPRAQPATYVEVQIVTALQEAWDKKDHFLIYERRRAGDAVPDEHLRQSFALSEMHFLADTLFDQLKTGGETPPEE